LRQVSNPAHIAPAKAAVFVLPFRDAGPNGVDADLRGRITDAFIIDSLVLIEGVRRSPRKSGWAYSDEDQLRRSLAKTNDMRHILTGRIGGTGDTLTLTLRLYEMRRDQQLWMETVSWKENDIIGFERRGLNHLVTRLGLTVTPQEQGKIDLLLANNLEALRYYRLAQTAYTTNSSSSEWGYNEVKRLARQAQGLDSNYVDAYFLEVFMDRSIAQECAPTQMWPALHRRLITILDQDDTHAGALDQMSGSTVFYLRDWAAADSFVNRMLQSSSEQNRLWLRGFYCRLHGWSNEARIYQEKSEHPEPTNPLQWYLMICSRWVDRHYAEGIKINRRAMELYPVGADNYLRFARCFVAKGDYLEGIQAIQKAQEFEIKQELVALLGYAYARMGQTDKAKETLQELFKLGRIQRYQEYYFVARVYAALGDKEKALENLEKAEEDKSEYLIMADWGGLRTDLAWDDLQNERRFKELLKKVGLDHWPRPKPKEWPP
jgi:tetratricopeptide (TPR) repeat protein